MRIAYSMASQKVAAFLLGIVLLLAHAAHPARAQENVLDALTVQALKGSSGVTAVVVTVPREMDDLLSASSLRAAAELELRRAGIAVDSSLPAPSPAVGCDLTSLAISGPGRRFAVSYNCYAMQAVQTIGTESSTVGRTWIHAGVAIWGSQVAAGAAREVVVGAATEFANLFLTANPPQPNPR